MAFACAAAVLRTCGSAMHGFSLRRAGEAEGLAAGLIGLQQPAGAYCSRRGAATMRGRPWSHANAMNTSTQPLLKPVLYSGLVVVVPDLDVTRGAV